MSPDPGHTKQVINKLIMDTPISQLSGYLDVNKETRIGALNMRRISYWETGLVVYDVRKNANMLFVAFISSAR